MGYLPVTCRSKRVILPRQISKIIKMSQTINGNMQTSSIPPWMMNIVQPSDSFESEIANKIGPSPHYPGPIHNIGGLRVGSHCRIPGVQPPFVQSILRPKTCLPHCLTKHCYEYGNTRFPPSCECDEKYNCRSFGRCYQQPAKCGQSSTLESCKMAGWSNSSCTATCGSCNHNSNVIYY